MSRICDWLDVRTGYRQIISGWRDRVLPGGPSWWLTSASCLLWLFVVQMVTGLLLMTTYSPAASESWASVHYIELSPFGSLIRGIHYFAAHALIITFALHVLRVLAMAGFRAPRELVWLTGILLMPVMIAWAVTGNPLAGSQKGLAQIEVEGNIVGSTPLLGPLLRQLLIGGEEVGNLTMTHLYFLHVGLLPLMAIGLLALHLVQVHRHSQPSGNDGERSRGIPYWPFQTARNATVFAAVLIVIIVLAARHGAPLDAPADPDLNYMPRPEWYFRCLFELRRYFTGEWEFIATLVLPLAGLLFFIAIPFVESGLSRRLSQMLRVAVIFVALGGWGWLTWASLSRDWSDGDYRASQAELAKLSQRARLLADHQQIPPAGARAMLRSDAKTRGPILFARHCGSCHSHADLSPNGLTADGTSAPDLTHFGTSDWVAGLLDPATIASAKYFGKTKFAQGEMAEHIRDQFSGAEDAQALRAKLRLVAAALAAEAELPATQQPEQANGNAITEGRKLLTAELGCTDCHRFHDQGELGSAPDLTGYGSREWLTAMISNPQSERFYGDERNDRMPAFLKDPQQPKQNLLSDQDLELLVDWLRGQWYEPAVAPAANSAAARPNLATN